MRKTDFVFSGNFAQADWGGFRVNLPLLWRGTKDFTGVRQKYKLQVPTRQTPPGSGKPLSG